MVFEELLNLITNNGIGIVCVAYLIYFQSTTMRDMLDTLNNISDRLISIELKLNAKNKKGEKSNEIKQG